MRLQRIGFLDGERIGNIRLYYSTKKIDEKANWAIEEKAGDNYNGEDPFTLKKREKKYARNAAKVVGKKSANLFRPVTVRMDMYGIEKNLRICLENC